ncbi:hypothetical protein GCM10028803_19600 [Larkinella knui]|uniref:DUF3575 domain-containing protein n=1 Tax=Larkinella knui TaxID=2025310 RepID=A0A3P1CUR4_9BACT|nr:hypothetical protein [Larkinella knui]RRB17055.1 hypothetical protein EHT87_01865 [Larkinella knui]
MKKVIIFWLLAANGVYAQRSFSKNELAVNAFRNPSVGLEYRHRQISVHVGYYPTVVSKNSEGVNQTTSFVRAGVSLWFLPVGRNENPSSFYTSLSYVRGLNQPYKNDNGLMADAGFRWMIWKGLNFRIGAALLASPHHTVKVNPTPGLSYSFFFK